MKQLSIFLFACFAICLIASCSKNKSADTPIPKESKEAVFICTENNNLISFHPATGAKQWEVFFRGTSVGVPVLHNRFLYLTTTNGYFYAIDVILGKITLEVFIDKYSVHSLAVSGGLLYMSADSFYCFNVLGNKLWSYSTGGAPCTSSPQLANGRAYFSAFDKIHAVNITTGNADWVSASIGFGINSSPRVSNGLIYFGADDRNIYAINESDGSLRWNYPTSDKVLSSPIVYGGMCIVGSYDNSIYCIDTISSPPFGLPRWVIPTNERVVSSAAVHPTSNSILIGSYDFNLYSINHVSGIVNWKYPSGSIIKSSPVVYKDYVYFTSLDRYLYCVDVVKGSLVWKSFISANTESSPMVDDKANGVYPAVSGMSSN
jgi:outer membrane protein assembly factor BamB